MDIQIVEGYRPTAIGRIVSLHARYYAAHAGFGSAFEAKVASELAAFCERYDEERDGLWLALHGGEIEGSIAIDGSGAAEQGAHLRWFIASDAIRGRGAGKRLLLTALEFCRARGYSRAYLWTFDSLDAARHLYEEAGFRLAHQERGRRWGRDVNEQRFEASL